jgi:histidinol-phosphate/aromatic aminotransferase/cobyric acid decarboxylase-like protein
VSKFDDKSGYTIEKADIVYRMDPVRESFSLSLNSSDIAVQTERYHESLEHSDYEETLRAALDGGRPRLLVPADTANSTQTLPPFIPRFISCHVLCRQSI